MNENNPIYRHLHDLMSPQEKVDFEKKLEHDPELKTQWTMERTLYHGIESFGRQKFKEKVSAVVQRERRRQLLKRILFGVGVLLLAVAAIYWFAKPEKVQQRTPDQIFAQHFNLPVLGSTQRNNTDDLILEDQIKGAYQTKDFEKIISLSNNLSLDNISPEIAIICGVASIESENPKKGIEFLAKVEKADVAYYDHAQWYTAMAYIKSGELDAARDIIEPMVSDVNHDHHMDAREIIKFLRK